MAMAALMLFLGNPHFASSHLMRDLLLSGDSSLYAMLNKVFGGRHRGMSYEASAYIMAQIDGVRVVAIAYCAMAVWFWKSPFYKSLPKVQAEE